MDIFRDSFRKHLTIPLLQGKMQFKDPEKDILLKLRGKEAHVLLRRNKCETHFTPHFTVTAFAHSGGIWTGSDKAGNALIRSVQDLTLLGRSAVKADMRSRHGL